MLNFNAIKALTDTKRKLRLRDESVESLTERLVNRYEDLEGGVIEYKGEIPNYRDTGVLVSYKLIVSGMTYCLAVQKGIVSIDDSLSECDRIVFTTSNIVCYDDTHPDGVPAPGLTPTDDIVDDVMYFLTRLSETLRDSFNVPSIQGEVR